jgi:predicted transcriptional regulator
MSEILVADLMTRDPITVKPTESLLNCAKKIVRKRVGSLLITDRQKLVGFISQRDIMWAWIKKSKKDLSKIKAIEISPKKIATVKPDMAIREVISRMKKLKFERLPVVQDNKLVGIITAKDILSFHPEFYPEIEEFARIREEARKLKRIKQAQKENDGICEECGQRDFLTKFNGMMVCENCRNS